ncbi:MAG: PhoH family protein [Clostridiales bacterium]|nr:PhoH family protein [Clostridiales bacterium]MDD6053961.1 PhoH family protein [Clostridiales bacterium]MDY5677538.1 PhoH family protein [Eubacteriales bacterium]
MANVVKKIETPDFDVLIKLFGPYDENVNEIKRKLNVDVLNVKGELCFSGDEKDVELAGQVVRKIIEFINKEDAIDIGRVTYLCDCARDGRLDEVDQLLNDVVAVTTRGKLIKSKTVGQKKYVEAIKKSIVTIAVGPAGTGKTYLAVALAASAYKAKQIDKIILTRPAVEAGEKLGFLPGDLQEKVNPYLRPLYDGLQEMFGLESYQKLIERGAIEVAPLAYMRGRTLSNAFIILDEAQNTTREQMKMFLTRLGENSRMVVTGDLTQTDLPEGKKSGLREAVGILKNIEGISVTALTEKDVVRHPLVQAIVKAYERSEKTDRN